MLENGEMNPEKQDNCPLPKEKTPVIKKKKLIERTMKKRKPRTKVQMLSESSELDLKKAKDPKNYEPPHWPDKKYVPAINDLPEYQQYWLSIQKKTTKANRRKRNRFAQRQKEQQNTGIGVSQIPVYNINKSESNLGSGTSKPILKRIHSSENDMYADSTVPLKGPRCAKCVRNQYCSNAGAAAPYIRFRTNCLL